MYIYIQSHLHSGHVQYSETPSSCKHKRFFFTYPCNEAQYSRFQADSQHRLRLPPTLLTGLLCLSGSGLATSTRYPMSCGPECDGRPADNVVGRVTQNQRPVVHSGRGPEKLGPFWEERHTLKINQSQYKSRSFFLTVASDLTS